MSRKMEIIIRVSEHVAMTFSKDLETPRLIVRWVIPEGPGAEIRLSPDEAKMAVDILSRLAQEIVEDEQERLRQLEADSS